MILSERHIATYIDWIEDLSVEVAEIDQQHKGFLVIINDLYEALENKNEKQAQELLYFLKDYLADHLIKMDHKCVKCFKEHGLE